MLATLPDIQSFVRQQRNYFDTGATQSLAFRQQQLQKLRSLVLEHRSEIEAALKADLNKPQFEAAMYEIYPVLQELDYFLKHLKKWLKPQRVKPNLLVFPSIAEIYPDPLGVVLILCPWNYPFALSLMPLIGAIAAGNCVVIKPSEHSPQTSQVIAKILNQHFAPELLQVVEGGVEVSQALLTAKFDHIFFTGGTRIGQLVMEAAAKQLTPVTLELGGKSPCIIEPNVDLTETAKRIVWGKFLNAGQTCIAPDYLLVQEAIQEPLIAALKIQIQAFYGENPALSPDYCRIVNAAQFHRLTQLLADGEVLYGGDYQEGDRYFAPTLMHRVNLQSPLMQEEIFGPILPILSYQTLEEAIAFVNQRPKPLALYFFSNNLDHQEAILQKTSSGGVCINDVILQVSVMDLPFGGVGDSGMGRYHGKTSFDTFCHYKSVLRKFFWLELALRYPPYAQKLSLIKWFVK